MPNKQKQAIKTIEYFIPDWIKDWGSKEICLNDGLIGIQNIKTGQTTPEQVFFNKTERGIAPTECSNIPRLRALLWGHRWMATQKKMWIEASLEVTLSPIDFKDKEIREIFTKTVEKPLKRKRRELISNIILVNPTTLKVETVTTKSLSN